MLASLLNLCTIVGKRTRIRVLLRQHLEQCKGFHGKFRIEILDHSELNIHFDSEPMSGVDSIRLHSWYGCEVWGCQERFIVCDI